MKFRASYSPDVVSNSSPLLVPLRNKFKHRHIKELPGWRGFENPKKKELKVTSSKPFKVKNKNEYYSPLNFACEERHPLIFPSPGIKKYLSTSKIGRVVSLKEFNKAKILENQKENTKKISISLGIETEEISEKDDSLSPIFSHRSLENLKAIKGSNNSKEIIQKDRKTHKFLQSKLQKTREKVKNTVPSKLFFNENSKEYSSSSEKDLYGNIRNEVVKLPQIFENFSREILLKDLKNSDSYALDGSFAVENEKSVENTGNAEGDVKGLPGRIDENVFFSKDNSEKQEVFKNNQLLKSENKRVKYNHDSGFGKKEFKDKGNMRKKEESGIMEYEKEKSYENHKTKQGKAPNFPNEYLKESKQSRGTDRKKAEKNSVKRIKAKISTAELMKKGNEDKSNTELLVLTENQEFSNVSHEEKKVEVLNEHLVEKDANSRSNYDENQDLLKCNLSASPSSLTKEVEITIPPDQKSTNNLITSIGSLQEEIKLKDRSLLTNILNSPSNKSLPNQNSNSKISKSHNPLNPASQKQVDIVSPQVNVSKKEKKLQKSNLSQPVHTEILVQEEKSKIKITEPNQAKEIRRESPKEFEKVFEKSQNKIITSKQEANAQDLLKKNTEKPNLRKKNPKKTQVIRSSKNKMTKSTLLKKTITSTSPSLINHTTKKEEKSFSDSTPELSMYSVIQRIELDQKYNQKVPKGQKKSGLGYMTNFLSSEIRKSIRGKDPVKVFIKNFSHSFINCLIGLSKQSIINPKIRRVSRKNKNLEEIVHSDLAYGKLKTNKRRSVREKTNVKPRTSFKKSILKRESNSPVFYSREIALQTVLSKRKESNGSVSLNKNQPNGSVRSSKPIIELFSDCSSSNISSTPISEESSSDFLKNALVYEKDQQGISVRMANLMISQKIFDEELRFFDSNSCEEDSDTEIDLETEIKEMKSCVGQSPARFYFSAEVNSKGNKYDQGMINVKELGEEGLFFVDMDGLAHQASKERFNLMKGLLKSSQEVNKAVLKVIPIDEPNEHDQYVHRMRRIKKHLSQKKSPEKYTSPSISKTLEKALEKNINPLKQLSEKRIPQDGQTYEERIYLRLKNSPSSIIRPTTQVSYISPDTFLPLKF